MLFLVNILSPIYAIGIGLSAWVAALFWFYAAILGDPEGGCRDSRDDGRAAVLGVMRWWEGWLEQARWSKREKIRAEVFMSGAEQLIFFTFVDFGGVGTGEDEERVGLLCLPPYPLPPPFLPPGMWGGKTILWRIMTYVGGKNWWEIMAFSFRFCLGGVFFWFCPIWNKEQPGAARQVKIFYKKEGTQCAYGRQRERASSRQNASRRFFFLLSFFGFTM